ncbi:hypothetical protein ADK67_40880 [Saccharothrix sp. NRRL B-16348]|uniref:hypothetical protein n=1 Tax=Saccharothrix sp. NRRL B-16348 TaxID=1415542 RepID=UPI0006AEA3E5|nr:hypothetical protein [Saccharothrix sp. NRRL B-16348]KOX16070.1 hypothetical protein ADK67_40880 [Saccharothrix sp. NRRL B-16348]
MRIGGIILATVLLAGCSTAPVAAPPSSTTPATTTTTSSTPAAPDPALIEARLVKVQLPDDVLVPLGFTREDSSEQKNYSVVLCPTELPTDGAMSMTRLSTSWFNKPAFSYVEQFRVSYRRVAAAAETVQHARKALECQPFMFGDEGPYTPERELDLPPLGVDAQFGVCYTYELMRICQLVMSKADILARMTFYGPKDADAARILAKAGQATAPLMTS